MPDASGAKSVRNASSKKPSNVSSKKRVPRSDRTFRQNDVEGSKIDYSEESDLPEPDMSVVDEDIAAELRQEITGSNMPSVDLTLVGLYACWQSMHVCP